MDLDALHAAALIDLAIPDSRDIALTRALSSLETVAGLATRSNTVWLDLSAARLALASRSTDALTLLSALEPLRAPSLSPQARRRRYTIAPSRWIC